ncbi:MAG: acyl-CoA/acyl-ACP dehydrogenase [Actinomycetota bacterium]|nr:acyl-CoA/acyl-ACP dehydrogenase [Actinomycetota bacterium]
MTASTVAEVESRPAYLAVLAPIVEEVVAPSAIDIDRTGAYPRAAMDAMGQAGLLGLLSSMDVGGMGEAHRAAALVVEELARHCGSTAMVVLMHYAGTAVIEAYGPLETRREIAAGRYITTLAFSEFGSRSQFWVPMSTAVRSNAHVRLDARKSWVTSAGQANGYVWSSRPVASEGLSTLWLVSAGASGLEVGPAFDGLGLRGNYSSPMTATGVEVPAAAMLGSDGGGFDLMISVIIPYFQLMSAAFSIGTMEATTGKAAAHVAATRLEHLDQTLADNPVTRGYLARMRVKTDQARALLLDAVTALETGREDVMLRLLEVKAAASEAATEVTELGMRACGGSAFKRDLGIERRFRDARASTVMAPTSDTLYDFIGRAVCGLPVF